MRYTVYDFRSMMEAVSRGHELSYEEKPGRYRKFDGEFEEYVSKNYYATATPGTCVASWVNYGQQVMSDVWEDVPYATFLLPSRAYWTTSGGANVDAPAEEVAKYAAMKAAEKAELEAARLAREEARRAEEAAAEHAAPAKGKYVMVVKGRKVPKGTVGRCFWYGEGDYGYRVGLRDAEGTVHWTAASNCTAVDYCPSAAEVATEAASLAEWKAKKAAQVDPPAPRYASESYRRRSYGGRY